MSSPIYKVVDNGAPKWASSTTKTLTSPSKINLTKNSYTSTVIASIRGRYWGCVGSLDGWMWRGGFFFFWVVDGGKWWTGGGTRRRAFLCRWAPPLPWNPIQFWCACRAPNHSIHVNFWCFPRRLFSPHPSCSRTHTSAPQLASSRPHQSGYLPALHVREFLSAIGVLLLHVAENTCYDPSLTRGFRFSEWLVILSEQNSFRCSYAKRKV